ncbi:hypothetical protein pb186bvf_003160 [Paramecium bursaria]
MQQSQIRQTLIRQTLIRQTYIEPFKFQYIQSLTI